MSNSIKIHINRKFHIPLSQIVKVVQKKNGGTWVYYNNPHFAHPRVAIHKGEARSLMLVINTALVMRMEPQMQLVVEE
jgi:hypothetical protein